MTAKYAKKELIACSARIPERFAQQALGHNSKAVHHAYSKHAEVTVPSLDDWEKQYKDQPQGMEQPKVVQVDFTAGRVSLGQSVESQDGSGQESEALGAATVA